MTRRFLFVLCFVAGVAATSAPLPPPAEISSPAGPGSAEPYLAAGTNGDLLMTWLEKTTGEKTALKFALQRKGNWSPTRTIAERSDFFVNWADFPSIVHDNKGTLFVHWLQKSGTDVYAYDVHVARSTDDGATWSSSKIIHRDGRKAEHGFVSMVPLPKEGIGVVWLDGRNMKEGTEDGEMTLRYASVLPDGTVRDEAELDGRVCDCCTTSMAMTSEGLAVVYRDRSPDEIRDISFVRKDAGHWTKPVPVHQDGWKIAGCPVNGPQIDARGKQVAVAWFSAPSNQGKVLVAFSSTSGRSFRSPIRIDGGRPVGRVDIVTLNDGSALVTWLESGVDSGKVMARRVWPDGKLGPPLAIADSSVARSSGFPRMVRVENEVFFSWTDSGKPGRIRLSKLSLR
ncbi:MAG TPA: sialidase family protein [Thermoanaerobaculia bacterium]|nr:sialidase family protein [Thermoanaerobaculia bacterium]